MAKNRVKIITIKTVKPQHLHSCVVCGGSDVWVISRYLRKDNKGIARCEDCKNVREFQSSSAANLRLKKDLLVVILINKLE